MKLVDPESLVLASMNQGRQQVVHDVGAWCVETDVADDLWISLMNRKGCFMNNQIIYTSRKS